ncbi:MAG: IS66 family transposase [Euryarchaeota archaeon]|nr:IS66 family transposase [Euryarchaeota archaeon]
MRTESLRKKSGKKPGGQKNHPGKTLVKSLNPDEIHNIEVKTCTCGKDLSNVKPEKYIDRQVFELPKIMFNIIEYRGEVKHCPHCGRKITAEFPENVTQNVQFGENLKTHVIYLKNQFFGSYKKLETKFFDFYGYRLSPATMIKFEGRASSNLKQFEEDIREELVKSPVLNADETGFKVEGNRWWLHTISNDSLTLYAAHPKRGSIATDEMGVLPRYGGILVHDFWSAYSNYNCDHSFCNAHIMRELQGIIDGYKQKWAEEMKLFYEDIHHYLFIKDKNDPQEIEKFRERYMEIIEEGLEENPPPDENKKTGKRGRIKRSKPPELTSEAEGLF